MDLELERSLHQGPTEVNRLLERGSPGDGAQQVLEHTHKEQEKGKFEPEPLQEQWRIYKDAGGKVVSNVPYDQISPHSPFPMRATGKGQHLV